MRFKVVRLVNWSYISTYCNGENISESENQRTYNYTILKLESLLKIHPTMVYRIYVPDSVTVNAVIW